MSFCRITGKSRGLPKPNYFPLLPPISPADAKRFCRITGKSYGLPTHHYIPVVLGIHTNDKSKCKITNNSTGLSHHHYTAGLILGENKRHVVVKDYKYVFPILEGDGEHQKALRELLSTKEPFDDEEDMKFVYTVQERRCSLVFPARLEAAVRDGDVRDVMLSRDCDTVLLRLKQGNNVSVDFKDLEDFDDLYDGWGPREDVVKEREQEEAQANKRSNKKKQRNKNQLNYAKKVFEEKERAADEEELKRSKKLKLRSIREEMKEEKTHWKSIDLDHARSGEKQLAMVLENFDSFVHPVTKTCNWHAIERNITTNSNNGTPVVEQMPKPLQPPPQTIDLEATEFGVVTAPSVVDRTGGFEAISVIEPLTPLTAQPKSEIQILLDNIGPAELEQTAGVAEKFANAQNQELNSLPTVQEIPDIVKNLENGVKHELHKIKGLKVDIASAQRFVTGQTIDTPTGPLFVPGQTLQTPQGQNTFVPGFTVNTPDGPLLIPGQIVNVPENGMQTPIFIAGQTLETKCGRKFVQGQTFWSDEGAKFVMGQTVLTEEGPKFVAGQVVEKTFVPGQVVVTESGPRFIAGQTITDKNHSQPIFIPGQSVKIDDNWHFVPGQCLSTATGDEIFTPGRTMQTSEGMRFVPGQNVTSKDGQVHFVPGINSGDRFVPGTTLETPEGMKFIQGMVVNTPEGNDKFIPGTVEVDSDGSFQFAAAKNIQDIVFMEAGPTGIAIDPKTANLVSPSDQQELLGHLIQTDNGVEFIPESIEIPTQKVKRIVPGQLVRGGPDGPRFVPGVRTEEGFVPGQMVMTEKGEQFVPGQVVETSSGPKFVPGRMVDTRTGAKFVPGQTVETEEGPRFVPGQIVETKAGPTFIPGQVISTEDEGSRFVPGQVVDTSEGPRFVPGRVVESGEHGVTFVPGQIVQTENGPRFIAPDLTDTPEGEMEFSVQGFEVTPEELRLLHPAGSTHYNCPSEHAGEPTIDARLLRQLSEAGMSIGRKISTTVPTVDIDVDETALALEQALFITEKLGLRGDCAVKMAQVVSTISQLAHNIVKHRQNGEKINIGSGWSGQRLSPPRIVNGQEDQHIDWMNDAIRTAIVAAILAITDSEEDNSQDSQNYVLSSIGEAFNVFLRKTATSIEQSVNDVLKTLVIPLNRKTLCQGAILDLLHMSTNKIDILKSTVVGRALKNEVVLERLSAVLDEDHNNDLIGSAFRKVSKDNPELISTVLKEVSQQVASLETEKDAAETVHKAIVNAVRESSEQQVKDLLNDPGVHLKELLLQAIGLARALGMSSTATSLLAVISDNKSTEALVGDKVTLDILRRLTIMRKLAETHPQYSTALRELSSDPNFARNDPRLRTLVRESGALMIVPEEVPLQSSSDIPTALLCAGNSLAIEEFFMKRSFKPNIFMILKKGLQTVVPREASRDVLTGKVAYTVLDEDGISHFEPLHVFSALKLNKPSAHRFSMYAIPVTGEEEYDADTSLTTSIASSINGFDKLTNGHCRASRESSLGINLTDKTLENSSSRENTPSFRRRSSLYLDNGCERKPDNFVVVKDYVSESDNGFSVTVGDIVEAIEFDDEITKKAKMDPDLEIGEVGARLDNSAARHKLSVRPKRKYTDPRSRVLKRSNSDSNIQRVRVRKSDGREGWLPMSILMQTALSEDSSTLTSQHRPEDSRYRREAVVKELVETEEEFGRDLQMVVDKYLKPLDNPGIPRAVRDNKEIIFTNLKQIADFHNTVLIEGVKYYADQPRMLGKTFLRLERDFDKHVAYCRDEPAAQEVLQTNDDVREYFEELSQSLGDDKSVSEHLKLPIQRINDYQLLLKELVKYSTRLGENCDDLQKALELMLSIPHQATDNKFISNIEGFKGNIHKLGRLLTHEWFTVTDKEGKSKERYLFLFKARILVCKVRRISEDRSVFVLKDIIRLPEVELKDYPEDQRSFELHNPELAGYPIKLLAHKDQIKAYWLKEIRQYASDVVALAEHAADDLQVTEEKNPNEGPSPTQPIQSETIKETKPNPDTATKVVEQKPAEKRENPNKIELESELQLNSKKSKITEESQEMSGRYSSSRFSASSKVVEEYSSVSSSRNAVSSTYVESSVSGSQSERRSSSALYGAEKTVESSSSYQSAISGSTGDTRIAKLALTATETGKPKFVKTIEGIGAEPGESATFECTLETSGSASHMHWFKDNKPLDDKLADRINITSTDTSFKLQILNVTENDTGIYTARAANGEGSATCTAQLIVEKLTAEERKAKAEAKAPVFLVRLKDTELLENTYLRFMIKVKGDPEPDLKFYKDGVLIDSKHERIKIMSEKADAGFYELVIPDVQKQDAGKYSCTATNQFGEASCEATVTVTDEKTLFAGLPEGIFEPGSEPQFKWLRDGKPFDPEERFKVLFQDKEDTLALVFQHVKPEDAGLYTCVAQTSTGNISCSAELTVQGNVNQLLKEPSKPVLGSESKKSEVNVGGSAMLDLQVQGFPKPHITWSKDGKEIVAGGRIKYLWEDEESLSLVIKNVTADDGGTYTIKAKNELGEDTTYIELIVKSAPKITKRMTDTWAYIETETNMTVQIQASPAPTVTWYKDGQIIKESERIYSRKEENDNYTLVIKECKLEDTGSYSVMAKNDINQTSDVWNFDVRCPPKIKKKLGEPRIIEEGASLTLQIEVETTPEPTVIWFKDDEVIKEDHRVTIVDNGAVKMLKINSTIGTDAALYKAEVSNKDGKTVDQVGVEVKCQPRFKKEMGDVITKVGAPSAEFAVEVAGYPRPKVQWYINNTEINESKKEFVTSSEGDIHKLIINEIKEERSANYSCKLTNEYGSSSCSGKLIVYCKPKITKKLVDQKLKEGETLKLAVQITGTPDPQIKWFKDGQEVSADARIKITRDSQRKESYDLTLNLLKGSDGGTYEVRAENEMGSVNCKSKVIVLTKTEATAEELDDDATNKKVVEEDVSAEKQQAEGPEGREVLVKKSVERIKGKDGEKITISVESTTEHEATMTGPDERHTISKMKSTKVECQEMNVESPQIEEIASYSYTINDEDSQRAQNGVLIEEYSDTDDSKQKLSVNRGISIVSVSDEESVKALSTDMNIEEVDNGELSEGLKKYNRETVEGLIPNGRTVEEKIIEYDGPHHAMRYTETIIEESYIEDCPEEQIPEQVNLKLKAHTAVSGDSPLSKHEAKLERVESVDKKLIKQASVDGKKDLHEKPLIENSQITKEEAKISQVESIKKQTSVDLREDLHEKPLIENSQITKEEAKTSQIESIKKQTSVDLKKDLHEKPLIENSQITKEEAKISEIESIEVKNAQIEDISEKLPRESAQAEESKLTRQTSKLSRVNSTESRRASINQLSRQNSQTGVLEESKLSRQNSKISRVDSVESRRASVTEVTRRASQSGTLEESKLSRQSSRISRVDSTESRTAEICDGGSRRNSQRASITDANEDLDTDEKTRSLLERIKRQRSVLEEIIDQTADKPENGEIGAAPSIISHDMEDRTIYETQSTVFTVKATGLPRPDPKWFKDGKPLKSADKAKPAQTGETYTLTINKATEKETALYQLVLTNKLGTASIDAYLEVGPVADLRKPRFSEPLKDVDVEINGTGTLTGVLTADPVPDVTWLHDGEEIPASDTRYTRELSTRKVEDALLQCTYSLSFPDCTASDVGKYTLKATNVHGEDSSTADLELLAPPQILEFKDLNAAVEETCKWEVLIKSNPKAELTWERDGVVLDDENRFGSEDDHKNKQYRLILKRVEYEDAGTYKVIARNYLGEDSAEAQLVPYTEPPEFIKTLTNGAVRHDAAIELKVEARGIARPKIQWLMNGDEIVNDARHTITTTIDDHVFSTLTIVNFDATDEGELVCLATNRAGKAKTNCTLSMIRIPPTFDKLLPKSLDIDEGQPLELIIDMDGSPFPKVTWFKDGEKIVPDGHVKIETQPNGSTKLTIDKCQPTDCGAYKIIAKNNNGENVSQCAVAIKPTPRRPSFSKPLEDTHVIVGQPVKLEAQVVAFPTPEIQWFKDGLPLRPSQDVEFINEPNGIIGLSIDAAKPEDAGVYSLVVKNSLGELTGNADVEVEAKERKPGFLTTLQPVTVVEGFPAKLEVTTVGKPAPLIKWTHNGVEIVPDGQHIKVVSQPDGSHHALLIDKVTGDDAGEYGVIATNSEGEEASHGILSIAGKKSDAPEEKPAFLGQLRDVTCEEGETLAMSAAFTGNPLPDVTWEKDGEPIEPSDSRVLLICDGKKVGIEIAPASPKDAGVYRCRLANPLGDDSSSGIATIRKIYQKPSFTQRFTDLRILPGHDTKFAARITGIPQPDITWYFNDKPINRDSDRYKIKRDGDICCLYIQDSIPADAGRYKCRAVNKEGEASCEASLSFTGANGEGRQKVEPPSFLKRIGDCEIYKGMTAKFTACVTGYPEPSFEWYRNNERLWPTDRIRMEEEGSGLLRLIIMNIDEHDVGKYSLRIYNPHGEDICHAEMRYDTLEIRPKKPLADQYSEYDKYRKSGIPLPLADRPIISRMMDRHLTLSWKPSIPIGPRVPVTYLVEMCELPDGDWFTARSGIRSCVCDIRNLEPFRDYKFRIRVENKYGISDPSPFAQTYRSKILPDPPKFHPYLPPGIDFRPETSPYFPKDFDIERPLHDGYAQAPRFLRQEHDTQYGVKNHNCNLFWFVYGYPKPKMSYYFNGQLIESGGRYDHSYTRNGQATLFINKMLERDVGMYEAIAVNEHGEARQRVRLEIAEYPTFIQRPDELVVMLRKNGHLQARIIGVPYPEIKWYKDWKPLAPSARIKIDFFEPDTSILTIHDAIVKDEGLYSVSARNLAGTISCSVMVHIEENEHEYGFRTYTRQTDVKPKTKSFDDYYDLGDELGRGTQGITYHAVERATGKNYASKVMHGRGELRPLMLNEINAMNHLNHRNLLRLHDAYETDRSMILVTELGGGGELVDSLTRNPFYSEWEVAGYIRQILRGLEHMHNESWAHLGLTLGDLLISHPGGDELKIGDFGLSRRISYNKLMTLVYGMPEFVAPEVVNGDGVSYPADMWSLGIITHILLSGISPFRGANDRDTLTKIKNGTWDFDERWWINISSEAKDFVKRLLVYTIEGRMDVSEALRHPWLRRFEGQMPPSDSYKIPSENLKNYYKLFRDWYSNASCRNWYRRRRLSGAFEHPSKMVYPPGERYTPEPVVERPYTPREKPEPRTWENRVPSREPIDTEIGMFSNESHYQNGPDTYLLQLRDTDFPVRLREYMKVAQGRCPSFARIHNDDGYDWRTPVIRERRRFTDIMDEEIDDERRARINNYGTDSHTVRRLKHELGTRLDSYYEAEAMIEEKKAGHLPFFREKPQILQIQPGKCAQLTCYAVGNPKPTIQWYKNDLVIQEGKRLNISESTDGRSILSFNPTREYDIGIYKVVARNSVGQTVARTRIVLATEPGLPQAPEVCTISDTEILLRWKSPKDDGNSEILCYNLQYKAGDSIEWIDVASNIDHEFYLVKDLLPNNSYQFRLAARNRIGWGDKGFETALIQTKPEGAPKVPISRAMRHLQHLTESGQEIILDEEKPRIDYSVEDNPIEWSIDAQFTSRYTFISEVSRGQFSMVVKGAEKDTDKLVVAKILETRPELKEVVGEEFQVLRSLRHERIAMLEAAYWQADSPVAVFILEKLQGSDVLTYLASRPEYTENCVATIIGEVLDALQYLHWRGYCHLDIQPDNVVMASLRSAHVKLVDFGSAKKVSKLGTEVPQKLGHREYRSPEVLNEEPAYPQTDIWSVGVLAYVLLSGASPFKGADDHETRQNISFVRYRFEYLYKEISQEATRFLMLLFKRTPSKRPTAEECHEHRWLLPTEFMIKKRERASFPGDRLKKYNEEYHAERNNLASKSDSLTQAFGSLRHLNRSYSTEDELITSIDLE